MFWIYLVAVALVYSLTRNVFLQRLSGLPDFNFAGDCRGYRLWGFCRNG